MLCFRRGIFRLIVHLVDAGLCCHGRLTFQKELPDHSCMTLCLLHLFLKFPCCQAVSVFVCPCCQTARKICALFQCLQGCPESLLQRLRLLHQDTLHRKGMAHPATETQQVSIPDLPKHSATLWTRKGRRLSGSLIVVQCVQVHFCQL